MKHPSRQPQGRVIIERIAPHVDHGRFPIKRILGDQVIVSADIHADGYDRLAAQIQYQHLGSSGWFKQPMEMGLDDHWSAVFPCSKLGVYNFIVEAWVDRFTTWQLAIRYHQKPEAGLPVLFREGVVLLKSTLKGMSKRPLSRKDRLAQTRIRRAAKHLQDDKLPTQRRIRLATDPRLATLMRQHTKPNHLSRSDKQYSVMVERPLAQFGAWYEMFPRSAGPDSSRSATFREAEGMLPYISRMGFDVLYLPPIHPIGVTNRKGRNNQLKAKSWDPGSPWAIGSSAGGHMAIEPGLGTHKDFRHFVRQARRHRLDVAMDLAFHVSPDHPYVKQHPVWFKRQADGTIRYAENGPKKYQDVYPFNFESKQWRSLWKELLRIVEFWIDQGVTIFRLDNPHTKSFHFWEWLISNVRQRHPDVFFLSEAFTTPASMRYLAKVGCSQSYTYFTWRNSPGEISSLVQELASPRVRQYLRPNYFVNTPDILSTYLQHGGRSAFQIRLILAATLGASYGIYSGFELMESDPLRPGSEEYRDSEKYQFRKRNYASRECLQKLIQRINTIRRNHPALQSNNSLQLHSTTATDALCYSKVAFDQGDLILVIVNTNPHRTSRGTVDVPLHDWEFKSKESFIALDLLMNKQLRVSRGRVPFNLDPKRRVAMILHIRRLPRKNLNSR